MCIFLQQKDKSPYNNTTYYKWYTDILMYTYIDTYVHEINA